MKISTPLVIKCSVSSVAIGLIAIHLLRPNLKVDATTIALLVFAALPWLYSIIETVKLPGGFEITFRDVAKAAAKIGVTLDLQASAGSVSFQRAPALEQVRAIDPNLAVVGLRIDIEKCIRRIAEKHQIPNSGGLTPLVQTLATNKVLPLNIVKGIKTFIRLGNEAAHGARVDPEAAEEAIRSSQQIVETLNRFADHPSG